jgi:hypothetical protein
VLAPGERLTRRAIYEEEVALLERRFASVSRVDPLLGRAMVSAQGDRDRVGARWFPYREGFSRALCDYLATLVPFAGPVLDPFAGSGTVLAAANAWGLPGWGIELLPPALASLRLLRDLQPLDGTVRRSLAGQLLAFAQVHSWREEGSLLPIAHLRITAGAFSARTEERLARYRADAAARENPLLAHLLEHAGMSVLEDISLTRKDGQYLRWDQRASRATSRPTTFQKGVVLDFDTAIERKLLAMARDLALPWPAARAPLRLLEGSCLEHLPRLGGSVGSILTSPPYCNRYDYTRTYALELAYLGVDEAGIRALRQRMLSATVENLPKAAQDGDDPAVAERLAACSAFRSLLEYLTACQADGLLNNTGVVRMVRQYFSEMAQVIAQGSRLLAAPGAPFVMVNDNVHYADVSVPVDLILAQLAEASGLRVRAILALPQGKGNSSQQMAKYGRQEERKCVYLWEKEGGGGWLTP